MQKVQEVKDSVHILFSYVLVHSYKQNKIDSTIIKSTIALIGVSEKGSDNKRMFVHFYLKISASVEGKNGQGLKISILR